MKIAYTKSPDRGKTDLLLQSFSDALLGLGHQPVGTVQINTGCAEPGQCDMDVKVLPAGPTIRISQSLGTGSRGCRLDPSALEQAVALTERQVKPGVDCLIVNKFGKHEASGGGFRPVIAKALEYDVPVIVGISRLNLDEFLEFTGGMAAEVTPDLQSLLAWFSENGDESRAIQQAQKAAVSTA